MPFVAATAALARAGFPLYGAASPVLVLVHRFLKPDGEPFVERTVKLLALASVWAYWSAGVAGLLLYVLFQLPITAYHALAVYVPLLIIAFKRDRNARYDRYKRFILRVLFDAPLIITAISLRYLCGWHLFTPFASIIDDEVVQGTLPFACDVEELANGNVPCTTSSSMIDAKGVNRCHPHKYLNVPAVIIKGASNNILRINRLYRSYLAFLSLLNAMISKGT